MITIYRSIIAVALATTAFLSLSIAPTNTNAAAAEAASSAAPGSGTFVTASPAPQEIWTAAKQPTMMMVLVVLGLILAIYFIRRHLKNNQARQEANERSSLGRSDDDYYGEEMRNRRSGDRNYGDNRYDSDYRNDFNSTTGGGNTKNPAQLIPPNAPGKNTFADVAGQP